MKRKIINVLFALVLVLSFSLVMATPAAAATLEVGAGRAYTTLTDAIAAASPGDTITVYAGTYNAEAAWPIDVSKQLVIQSAAGAATTIIDPGASGQGAIKISAASVTLDGFTVKGGSQAYTADDPQENAIWVLANYSTIKNNTIINYRGNQAGIYIGNGQANTPAGAIFGYKPATPANSRLGHTIQDNTFRQAGSGEGWGIFAYDLSDSLIHGNSFVGDAADVGAWNTNEGAPGTGIIIHTATAAVGTPSPGGGYVVIENNTARYLKYTWLTFYAAYMYTDSTGYGYEQPEASTVDKVIVQNNTVYDCGTTTGFASGTAVNFKRAKKDDAYGAKGAALTVGSNYVTIGPGNSFYNLAYGIKIDAPTQDTAAAWQCVLSAENIIVVNNNIYSTTTDALYNGTIVANQVGGAKTVTAETNWWGNASGPTHSGNTFNVGSQGDIVTDSVDYVPWLNGVYLTGASFAPVINTTADPDTKFSSIEAAVTAATAADTLNVYAGTYSALSNSWPIDISKALTIQSVAGAATTIIDPAANGQGAIKISANSVTLDGFTIRQGTLAHDASHPVEHTIWVLANYSTIKNNTIIGAGGNQACIYIGDRQAGVPTGSAIFGYKPATPANSRLGHTIQGNTFRYGTATTGSGEGWGIFAYDLSDSLIKNNTFVGDAADVGAWNTNEGAPGTGIIIHTATAAVGTPSPGGGYVVIENNTARYLKYTWLTFYAAYMYADAIGGGYEQPEASTVDKVIVQNNTVYDCGTTTAFAGGTAVKFYGAKKSDAYGVKGADLTVGSNKVVIGPGNTFYNLTNGVYVNEPRSCTDSDGYACVLSAENILVRYNSIYNCVTYGLANGTTIANQEAGAKTIVADYNWWGTAAGAYHATTNPGVVGKVGATVTDSVTYAPWLYLTTVANSGDTVANIYTNQVPSYAKSVLLSSGWNTFSVPIALDGQYNTWGELYTLTTLPYTVAYRFDSATQTFVALATTSTYALAPGEAVYVKLTAANSIPYCYSTEFSVPSRNLSAGWNLVGGGMTTRTEIASCTSIVTAGGTAGYTQIISPAENAAAWVYIAGAGSAGSFVAGEGYWVFLPIARTLGLFDLTPVAWVVINPT